ncbi:hypothetical protein LMG7974_00591 [Campylobacter majalis]|uniref:Insulinase family protein n=1 Tax=Campylobacter majalis TaxID=2790656 RepID=A0ABM8Q4F4_9BACT|nr:M16 family metallopeptidase [Campylobacter majalis]CAD7287711.1 hypothetical protein LMG7974_00591 [Campylobacter majalis]
MKKIILLIAICVSAFALRQDQNMTHGVLENGLEYFIKQNTKPKGMGHFYLIVNAGSTDELPNERGLAHFVEHMAFNGSRDFDKNELIKTLEGLGVRFGADLNAQTGYDRTSYNLEIKINDENLKSVFMVFNNWIDGVSFDENELEKERGVIMAEERQRNTPQRRLFVMQAQNLYKDSIYDNKMPIGDMDIIRNVDVDTIKGFYDRTYQPRNMKFVAVGDFDEKKIQAMVKQYFSSAKNTNDYQSPDKTIPIQKGFSLYNYDTNETATNSVNVVYIDKYEPRTNQAVAKKILLNSYISSLIRAYYEKRTNDAKTLTSVGFSRPTVVNQMTFYTFSSSVVNDDFNRSISEIQGIIKGVKEHGFSQDDFENAKKTFLSSIKARYKNSKDKKSKNLAEAIVATLESKSTILSDEDLYELSKKQLNEITLDDVKAEFERIINLDANQVSIMSAKGIKISEDEYKNIAKNAVAFNTNESGKKLPKTLVSEDIKPKKIVKKEYIKEQDINVYTLPNGAKVVTKELNATKNNILFQAISRGGVSTLDIPRTGVYATNLSNQSGAGEFDNYDISRILSGKVVSYEKRIEQLSQGYFGSSSTDDFVYLLHAINLEFNSPRLDENVLSRMKIRAIDGLKKSKELPEYKYNKELVKFIYNDHPRMKEVTQDDINALEISTLRKIVDEKFTNAANYTFFIVGDFKSENIEPLIEKYIATLPSKAGGENFKDDGVRTLNGVHEFSREYQTSKRSDVVINFKNENAKYSKTDNLKIRALNAVLKAMLRENIREEKGQTYGFGTNIMLNKHPYEHASASISFTCSPDAKDEIISEIKRIIKTLKEQGSTEIHIDNFKQASLVQLPKSLISSEFWMRNLISHFIYENDLFDKKWYEDTLKSITNDDIKALANKYLNEKDLIITSNDFKQ